MSEVPADPLQQLIANIESQKTRYEREQRETNNLKALRAQITHQCESFARDNTESLEECETLSRYSGPHPPFTHRVGRDFGDSAELRAFLG